MKESLTLTRARTKTCTPGGIEYPKKANWQDSGPENLQGEGHDPPPSSEFTTKGG